MDLEKMQSLRAEFLERPENSWMPKYPFVPGGTVVDLGGVLKTASRLIIEAVTALLDVVEKEKKDVR